LQSLLWSLLFSNEPQKLLPFPLLLSSRMKLLQRGERDSSLAPADLAKSLLWDISSLTLDSPSKFLQAF
jgi:hypothetical protein